MSIAAATGGAAATLTNVGNTISGAGLIGSGGGELILVNDKIIDATGTNNALVRQGNCCCHSDRSIQRAGCEARTFRHRSHGNQYWHIRIDEHSGANP
jgi:hypothetical protein